MTVDETIKLMARLIDLAAEARRDGREDDCLLYLQEVLALAETLPKKADV